ncbi:MAG TPA: DUF1080 domain-containing protein [Terriglobia bacterium]|nr:DUF1080 domain-containing protein [Terriglobia bacterium]
MRFFLSLVATLVLLAIPSGAQKASSAWVPLFNGKDLSGWTANGTEKWVVEDGTILGESTTGHYGYLTTDKTYRDFKLRLKFKPEAKGNSGVFIRSRITGNDPEHGPDIEGMQVEVDPTPGNHTGGLYESGGRGWVIQPTPQGEQALKPDTWNDLEITAQGSHIVTRLNGVQIVDFHDPTPRFTDGVIGLQLHTGGGVKMRWKDIEIQEPPSSSASGAAESTVALPANPTDVDSISAILHAAYDTISGRAGQQRDWNRFRSLFVSGARLAAVVPDHNSGLRTVVFSPDEYVKQGDPYFQKNGFFEREIARRTEKWADIAQVFSTYESRHSADDSKPFERGINSFQLMNDGHRWWIVTIFWQGENSDKPIPKDYLEGMN